MNAFQDHCSGNTLPGNLLRLGERREIAIYLRDGTTWIADFQDGRGEIFTVGAWFSLNNGGRGLGPAQRRLVSESVTPLPEEVVERIEHLHRRTVMSNGCLGMSWALATLVAGTSGRLARLGQSLFGPRSGGTKASK